MMMTDCLSSSKHRYVQFSMPLQFTYNGEYWYQYTTISDINNSSSVMRQMMIQAIAAAAASGVVTASINNKNLVVFLAKVVKIIQAMEIFVLL